MTLKDLSQGSHDHQSFPKVFMNLLERLVEQI
jgi:hypothetical protein